MINKIEHIGIAVRDLKKSEDLFEKLLLVQHISITQSLFRCLRFVFSEIEVIEICHEF